MNNKFRNILIWILIFGAIFGAVIYFQNDYDKNHNVEVSFSDFMTKIDSGKISSVEIQRSKITGECGEIKYFSYIPEISPIFLNKFFEKNIKVIARPIGEEFSLLSIISWLPFLFLIFLFFMSTRQIQSGNSKAMNFSKSRAKSEKKITIKFSDVAGVHEAKENLMEVVDFLRDPKKFQKLGCKIPKGFLLVGPPGTGKTLLAKAVAGEAGVQFFSIAGSDFVELYVGVGASRVRNLFEQAKKHSPCIIFIDEIDAVGRHRGIGMGGGNDEREQTLNQLLVEMDGFEENNNVIVLAATNRPDVLDKALLRPGRFDRKIIVTNPDVLGREQILNVHSKKIPLAKDVEMKIIAKGTQGFSGADLANLVNEAAIIAAKKGRESVIMADLDESKDRVIMGTERRSMVITEKAKKLTAFHEAGHALVASIVKGADPIHKATIVPRGEALGMVVNIPDDEILSITKETLIANIMITMGGRVAEELIFGSENVTTGASSDINAATNIVKRMVTEFGMSEKIGFINCSRESNSYYEQKVFSEEMNKIVDVEIKSIVDKLFLDVKKLISENKDKLEKIALSLIEKETLTGAEINELIFGKKIESEKPSKNEEGDVEKIEEKKEEKKSDLKNNEK